MSGAHISTWAARYIERLNFVLTYSAPGQKGPRHEGWNTLDAALRTPDEALQFFRAHPLYGIGALLWFSSVVSLDADHVEWTRMVLGVFGISLDEIVKDVPRIVGNPEKFRCLFRAPEGVELKHRTVMWPQQADPRKGLAVFELRAGPVSDALPPTIHIGTKQPYRWAIPPVDGFPPLPQCLLNLWTDWPETEKKARAVCPWAPPRRESKLRGATLIRRDAGPSVIDEFNKAHNIVELLERYGYRRQGKRFTTPDSHHAAGLVLLDSGRIYSHHAGDVLGGGRSRDAFDVWTTLNHGGDIRAATRAAAKLLGIEARR